MYCENCGKKLIRGYQFCMECGTPVPPEVEEEEENEDAQANEQSASEQPSGECRVSSQSVTRRVLLFSARPAA